MKCQCAVMRAKLGPRRKEVSQEVGRCFVMRRQSFLSHRPQPERETRLCGKHTPSPATQLAAQHTHTGAPFDLAFPSKCLRLGNYKNSKTLCCTCILPWGMGGKTNNT